MSCGVLCRFERFSEIFLPAEIRRVTTSNVEVIHPITRETLLFKSPEDERSNPTDLDVVLNVAPEGKRVNISCPVLVPDVKSDNTFVQCVIVDKKYKPLRVKVQFSDGTAAWLARHEIRVMESPWARLVDDAAMQKRKRKKSCEETSTKYKKGDIVKLPHGVLKKVPICITNRKKGTYMHYQP